MELFKQKFPKTEVEMEEGLWFFDEDCPGGAVWLHKNGTLVWT
nr:DUF596 domain-containing protein [Limnobaculum zhutongyuii]